MESPLGNREPSEQRLAPALTAAPSARQPDRFAHFELLEVLGSGGMGEVHLARDLRLDRIVALKLIQPGARRSNESMERSRREARVVARLDHPNICKLYEADEHDGWPFLALQYVEGETLAAKITRRRGAASAGGSKARGQEANASVPRTREEIAETIAIIETVARAVHHAHEHGVIHRDLKPGNLMIQSDGQPVVLDFGLAREEPSLEASLSSSAPLGTPLYMAPEQIESGRIGRHTDVYALGVILYECLTLERPFEGHTERQVQDAILASDPVAVDRRNRALPRDLAVVVAKAMEKSPLRRYRTALALAEDLARVRAREPVLARPVSVLGRIERWTRRNPSVALLLLTLTAGLGLSLWQYGRAEKNLDRFLQMSDVPIVQALVYEADEELWPAHPDKLPRLRDWLGRMRRVEARLSAHRAALAEVRARALPMSDDLRDEEQELEALRQQLRDKRALLASAKAPEQGQHVHVSTELADDVAELESQLLPREAAFERERWQFAASDGRFLHDQLAYLVRTIEGLAEPDSGRAASVAARLREAETLAERSIGDEGGSEAARRLAAAWREAASRLAKDAGFAGFVLRPQIGLVPLGRDPQSQLEEFAHLLSGTPAVRDEQGKLSIGDDTGIVLVLIPRGTFLMGAQTEPDKPNCDPMAEGGEAPPHEVTLEPYLIAKHEMTQGQWLRISGRNPSGNRPCGPGCPVTLHDPVETVSWEDCVRMLGRLGLRLPTEAQWERAARAGTDTPWWTGRDESALFENLAGHEDGHDMHAPIGSFRANPFGLWDTIGNVKEWCDDALVDYKQAPCTGDGRREAAGARLRCLRGGSMGCVPREARSALRHSASPTAVFSDVGCRPARDVSP